MSKKYWQARYELLKKQGEHGSMSWGVNQKVIDFQNEIKPYIDGQKMNTVIDFGCGTGKNAEFLVDVFRAKKYIGYDIINFVLKENKKLYPFGQFKLFTGELVKADIIWASWTLQHIENIEPILKAFKKALNPGGKIYIINCICEGQDSETMFFRTLEDQHALFHKLKLKTTLLYRTQVTGSAVGLFEVTK